MSDESTKGSGIKQEEGKEQGKEVGPLGGCFILGVRIGDGQRKCIEGTMYYCNNGGVHEEGPC